MRVQSVLDPVLQTGNLALRACAIEREATQSVAAASKELFAERDETAAERLDQANTDAIGPNNFMNDLFVVGALSGQFDEIRAGAKLC